MGESPETEHLIFQWSHLVLGAVWYLIFLFLLAYFAEKGKVPNKVLKHPLVYVLAFGVSCGSWAFYGSVGMAYDLQHGYMAFYIGITILLLFSAIIIRPLFNLAKNYQLSSLADLFAFRYRSKWVGLVTASSIFVAIMPLLALQIQAITDVIVLLDPKAQTHFIAALISLLLLYITMLFGTRDIKPSEKHPGLLFALAVESLFKLIVFLVIGYIALTRINGGIDSLQHWITRSPATINPLSSPITPTHWFSLLLIFFTAPIVLPHLFQILFRESSQPGRLSVITWAAPLYLLLMSLPVLPIMWAGLRSGIQITPEYYTLGVGMIAQSPALIWLTFLGGLSAACGMTIFAVLSLSSMVLNHVVLPFYNPGRNTDVYHWLLWVRRILIALTFILIFAFYALLNQVQNQSTLIIACYSGLLQLTPGIIGLLFWKSANRKGMLAGAAVGLSVWLFTQFFPMLGDSLVLSNRLPLHYVLYRGSWAGSIIWSIVLNSLTFFLVSIFSKTSPEEKNSAEICMVSTVDRRQRIPLKAKNVREFVDSLIKPLGQVMAEREVRRALKKLKLDISEYRPYALRRLRDTLEANLSGIMGPSVAQAIVSRYLPYEQDSDTYNEDIHFLEQNLDNYHYQLSGMAAELDRLRRHHRDTLYRLPIGVCSLTSDREILLWNEVMIALTGIHEEQAIGANIDLLPGQWYDLLGGFVNGAEEKITIEQDDPDNQGKKKWFSLHRRKFGQGSGDLNEGIIILLEDETEHKMLESELVHSERLASIGQLAAGVAHEIGNPITGIDCLAQDLKYAESPEEITEIAQQIRNQTDRVTKIVGSLVNFSHSNGNQTEHQPHSLAMVVQEAIDLLALSRDEKQIVFVNEINPELAILCEPQRLSQVFINLLGNARDASPAGEKVIVAATADTALEAIDITVTDRGTGIEKEHQDHIFEPFFTTKEVGKGTGLGLFLSYTIVEEHFGHISVQSPAFIIEDVGTRFTIRLPLHTSVTSSNT